MEAPALPASVLGPFLDTVLCEPAESVDACEPEVERATVGLLAARDIVLERPPSREPAVTAVLRAARGLNATLRDRAVRLLVNRLWTALGGALQPEILQAALESLDQLAAVQQVKVESVKNEDGSPGSYLGEGRVGVVVMR